MRRDPHDTDVLRDIPYLPDNFSAHRLDVYRPRVRDELLPVVFYIHGGGFTVCSKETHWMMGELFAQAGYCLVNVEYRLAPGAPYPAAVNDVRAAWDFVVAHAAAWGADAERAAVAGESAGANLALGLALSLGSQSTLRPKAVLAACGLHQVSDPCRFQAASFVRTRLEAITRAYAPGAEATEMLASPLLALEDLSQPATLPPVLIQVGTRDWVQDDSLRLQAALERRGLASTLHTYAGQRHAFHALFWTQAARQCWRDTFAFLQGCGLAPQARGERTPNS